MKGKIFQFDRVFDPMSSQEMVYAEAARPIVQGGCESHIRAERQWCIETNECDYARRAEWLQRHGVRVWSDGQWQDTHHGGKQAVGVGGGVTFCASLANVCIVWFLAIAQVAVHCTLPCIIGIALRNFCGVN